MTADREVNIARQQRSHQNTTNNDMDVRSNNTDPSVSHRGLTEVRLLRLYFSLTDVFVITKVKMFT